MGRALKEVGDSGLCPLGPTVPSQAIDMILILGNKMPPSSLEELGKAEVWRDGVQSRHSGSL